MKENELPSCPRCCRNDTVIPLTLGLVGGYPVTVEFKCTACQRFFKPEPRETGFLTRRVMS